MHKQGEHAVCQWDPLAWSELGAASSQVYAISAVSSAKFAYREYGMTSEILKLQPLSPQSGRASV